MSLHEQLASAASKRLELPEDLEVLPDVAAEKPEDGYMHGHELLEDFTHLPKKYHHLMWASFSNVRQEVIQAGNHSSYANKKVVPVNSPAVAGLALMTRYLYMLPAVYVGQRGNYAGLPSAPRGKAADLGAIARRSAGYITDIAALDMNISATIEDHVHLHTRPQKKWDFFDDSNYDYLLQDGDDGLTITGRFSVQKQAEAITESFYRDPRNEGKKLRGIGCLAVNMKDPSGTSLFEKLWHQFVDTAAGDARFFEADIAELESLQRDYGYEPYAPRYTK